MSTSKLPADAAADGTAQRDKTIMIVFVAAIFVSAALLFMVQPLFTKMVVPRLGGAAAVWSVAMVFFQTMLLLGYAYAHALTLYLPGRKSLVVHLLVMLAACLALPLHIAGGWGHPPQSGETFWLIGLFAMSIGLPFFALSANAPLLQAWFSRTGHPDAKNPYFLYAASNVGSFAALMSYPTLIEPFLRIGSQTSYWSFGFYVLILLLAGCGFLLLRSPDVLPANEAGGDGSAASRPNWRDVAVWIVLAAVPSGLLIAVTAHIATDVAAVPLLWILPLALYLLTFVIVFQNRPVIPHDTVVRIQPLIVLVLACAFVVARSGFTPLLLLAVHLAAFFVCTLLCHGELARRRPAARDLTAYYMWISAGGTIGGILTGLVAPHVFTHVLEYPILIILAVLCLPGLALPMKGTGQYPLLAAVVAAALALICARWFDLAVDYSIITLLFGVLLGLSVQHLRAPLPFAAIIAAILFGSYYTTPSYDVFAVRNFFGVLSVKLSADGSYHSLWHGTTGQGAQRVLDDAGDPIKGRPEMISEFFPGGGIDQVFEAVRQRLGRPMSTAVVGLGTGTLACQIRPGDKLTFYELDADIARIARNPDLFSYISECAPDVPIVLGDARLTLADVADGSLDLIFVDAFLGAAIPVHLLTREAMDLYFRKLKPDGIVAMHISNRNLELPPVIAAVARANGLIARIYEGGDFEEDASQVRWIPRVAAIARKDDDLGALARSAFWPLREGDPGRRAWTDDYSNILGAIIGRLRERSAP